MKLETVVPSYSSRAARRPADPDLQITQLLAAKQERMAKLSLELQHCLQAAPGMSKPDYACTANVQQHRSLRNECIMNCPGLDHELSATICCTSVTPFPVCTRLVKQLHRHIAVLDPADTHTLHTLTAAWRQAPSASCTARQQSGSDPGSQTLLLQLRL